MGDLKLIKESLEVAIFAPLPPIGLNMDNFMLEKTFYMHLKLNEYIKHIRFALKKIKPCEATIGINKIDIVVVTTNRCLCWTPHIRKHNSKRTLYFSSR